MDVTGIENPVSLSPILQIPESVPDLGVSTCLIEDLALKFLFQTGSMSLRELATKSRVDFLIAEEMLRRMRSQQLCEVAGMPLGIPQIAITSCGRARALELLSQNQYAGPVPVSLESYVQQVRQQSVRDMEVHLLEVRRAFSHLVLDTEVLRKLGTALNSGASIFLYGPSGCGKSVIAAALAKVFALDRVWVPHAVEVDGQIIAVYDPTVHCKVDDAETPEHDPRWVLCRRPTVMVGGELTIEMLELQFNQVTKFYTAPVQMKANCGVLIIDDFGRQRLRPEELLNRWIVPLDRRIDFLTLAGGKKVEIPFELFVIFATNLDPSSLADAAFLRRIQTKVKVGKVSEEQFREIFRGVCREFGLAYEAVVVEELMNEIQREVKEPLRACHPRDIINQVRWAAKYEQCEPQLNRDALLTAVAAYFVGKTGEHSDQYD